MGLSGVIVRKRTSKTDVLRGKIALEIIKALFRAIKFLKISLCDIVRAKV